jgi:hypothetical protein
VSEICRQAFLWVHRQYQGQQQHSAGSEEVQDGSSHALDDDIPF